MQPEPLTEPTSKRELMVQITSEHADLLALIAQIPPARRDEPLFDGWSLKDNLAHITDWEQYMLDRLRSTAAGEPIPTRVNDEGDVDRVNQKVYELNRDRDWEVIWRDFEFTYSEVLAELEPLSEEQIFDVEKALEVTGFDGEAALHLIGANTSFHYREHADAMRPVVASL